MANKIQIRRGQKTNLPTLDVGEPALCIDTKEVFVGNTGGNVALVSKETLDAHLGNYILQIPYGVAAGSANAYTATLSPAMTSYTEGVSIAVKINVSNTGASTININGLGAKSIRDSKGNALTIGKLLASSIYTLRYNGTNFILQGEGASGNAAASDLLSGKTASTDAGDITGTMPNRAGDNVNLANSVSGTILKLRAPQGYYDGVDDTVTITDADFIASNVKTGINLFGIIGTMPIKPDDYRGSPGAQNLIAGNGMTLGGYFGRYTGICTGNALASAAGISAGTAINYATTDIVWVKYGFEDKIIFIATKVLRRAVSWDHLNGVGCVMGTKQVTFNGITYKCRLVRVGYSGSGVSGGNGAADMPLLRGVHVNGGIGWDTLTDADLYFNVGGDTSGWMSLGQETNPTNSAQTYHYVSYNGGGTCNKNDAGTWFGWRPALEVV